VDGKTRRSGLSGFLFRVRAGVTHSHGGNHRQINAQDRKEARIGAEKAHIVDCIIAVLQQIQPSSAESNLYRFGNQLIPLDF
jgi:hypothetical protein